MSDRKRQPAAEPSTSTCPPKKAKAGDSKSLGSELQKDVFCSHCGDTILTDQPERTEDKDRIYHKDCFDNLMSYRKRQSAAEPSTSTCPPKKAKAGDSKPVGSELQKDVFCSHCGDTILTDQSESTEGKDRIYHQDCIDCFCNYVIPVTEDRREKEAVTILNGTQLFRKPLKQIGNSISHLRDLYVKKGEVSYIPHNPDSPLSKIKDYIHSRLTDGSFQYDVFDLRKGDATSRANIQSEAFVVICVSLAMALGFESKLPQEDAICDILIVKPNCPVLLLTVVNENVSSKESNIALARSTTNALRRFIDEDFHLVAGIVKEKDLESRDSFKGTIDNLVSNVSALIATHSLFVGTAKYKKVLTAIFASICEIKSVLESDIKTEYLHFLTVEQGKTFIDNLNSTNVNVTSIPRAGSSTLMLEVVKRLSILGKTLMIVRTKHQKDQLSSQHSGIVCQQDIAKSRSTDYVSQYRHVVDETNTVKSHTRGRLWTFTTVDPSELKHTEENLNKKNLGPTESDKDLHIQALQCQIEALRDKLCAVTKEKRKSKWIEDEKFMQPQEIKQEPADNLSESACPSYQIGNFDCPLHVSCPPMALDQARANKAFFRFSKDGMELENTERHGQKQGEFGAVRKYWGVCTRHPISVPTTPLTHTIPVYWETHTRVSVGRKGTVWRTLLWVAVRQEEEGDTREWVVYQDRNCWIVRVEVCYTHRPHGVCTQVLREGEQMGECWTNTLSRTLNTTAVLCYGVVLDVTKGRLAFLDLDRMVVLYKFDVQFTESLRPMFGVCPYTNYTLNMRLVCGTEIEMTDSKKDLICQALST